MHLYLCRLSLIADIALYLLAFWLWSVRTYPLNFNRFSNCTAIETIPFVRFNYIRFCHQFAYCYHCNQRPYVMFSHYRYPWAPFPIHFHANTLTSILFAHMKRSAIQICPDWFPHHVASDSGLFQIFIVSNFPFSFPLPAQLNNYPRSDARNKSNVRTFYLHSNRHS